MLRELMLSAADQRPVRAFVTTNPSMRALVERFVAGETREEALATAMRLNSAGAAVSLDHLGEATESARAASAELGEYLALLDDVATLRLDASVSVKLTALGLALDPELCERHLWTIVTRAAERDVFVRVDMESSAYTQATLGLVYRVFEQHRNVGIVIQSYLYRSAADVAEANRRRMRVRLCKGAYREPPEVAFPAKRDVDANYGILMERLLEHGNDPGLATHDERLVRHAQRFAAARGMGRHRFEFQMLYGVRRDLQARILRAGYRLRVYVPYGRAWYAYLTRRLAERPANVLFVVRSLLKERAA